jgi:hypothetical protein
MSCDYEIDLRHRLVRCRGWGAVTHADITETRLRFTHDPAFHPDFFQLYDFREVTNIDIAADQVRDLASYAPFSRHARRAIVAPQNAVYGLARMFATQREASGGQEQIRVFRSLAEANAWLSLEK